MKKNTLFVILSWLWLSLVIIASLVPKPKSYVRQMIRKLLRMMGRPDMDKNVHFIFYFLLVFFFIMAYKNTKWRAFILMGAIVVSGIIEIIQPIITHSSRKCDLNDFVYNVSGCLLGLIIALISEHLFLYFQNTIKTKPV
jgi:VanZ family protein